MKFRILISGPKVQDVGYRAFLLELASELNVERFHAKNVEGGVQILLGGDEALVNKFIEAIKSKRPPLAEVAEIKVERYVEEVPKRESFALSFMAEQLSKMVQVGLSMLSKQDVMIEKQDIMLNKQDIMLNKMDQMLNKQDRMLEKQDEMLKRQDMTLKKQDEMLGKMDLMLTKQDEMLKKQDAMLEKQDEMLKKQDMMLERQGGMLSKMDQMLNKQGETLEEIKGMREDFRSLFYREIEALRKELDELRRAIAKIEAKIGII